MELTLDQALRKGTEAHKAGQVQEADRLYTAILKAQPKHPDANHNMGVLAVGIGKVQEALPFFKTALEANPNTAQFWLSYIDALIKDKQFANAKQVLEQAKTQGVDGDRLNSLEAQLSPKSQKPNIARESPPQELLNRLLGHYQNGRLSDAEMLSVEITQDFPKHQFSWKVLAAVLGATGRKNLALDANQTAVALSPQDAEAHCNLGTTLQELGRLGEAEASYNQAIELKPDYAEAHYNLGNTHKKMGMLHEAEANYTRVIALKPDYADAHYNLGNTHKKMGMLYEAEANYTRAIALKPDYAEAHYNLGNTLLELRRLDEAEGSYTQALALKPDYSTAKHMLAALTGETTATAPRDYVEGLFDNYADKFENSLVENLEYKIPRLIAEMILKHSKINALGSIMDLGCGTGLLGTEIRQFCEYLEGIDLSRKMLDEAQKKNIYDKLVKVDIIFYLSNATLNFDYFVSTDVFVYIGDLSDVFKLIKSRNKTGGKLAFSTEDYDGDGFFLEKSGRYSHSKKYIEGLCKKFGYKLCHFETQALRKDKNRYIRGGLYILDF